MFVAGATGVLGRRVVPLLVAAGHAVAAMTRSPDKTGALSASGASPVVCDVLDTARLQTVVAQFGPDVVMHQVTDLPDDPAEIAQHARALLRVRCEGTDNLIAAARSGGAGKIIAQSVAWGAPWPRQRGDRTSGGRRAGQRRRRRAVWTVVRAGDLLPIGRPTPTTTGPHRDRSTTQRRAARGRIRRVHGHRSLSRRCAQACGHRPRPQTPGLGRGWSGPSRFGQSIGGTLERCVGSGGSEVKPCNACNTADDQLVGQP